MSPHMTGRAEPQTDGETRAAADLLDKNGNVDRSKLAEITNHTADSVEANEVTTIRRRLFAGATVNEVADDIDRGESTVRKHAKGNFGYPNGETPDMRPLQYRDGEWWVVDDE